MLVTIQGIVPEKNINYVMSGSGDAFFEEFIDTPSTRIKL
jgi:hypothetical protein